MATCIVNTNPVVKLVKSFFKDEPDMVQDFFDKSSSGEKYYVKKPEDIARAVNNECKRRGLTINGVPIKQIITKRKSSKGEYTLQIATPINRSYDSTQPLDQQRNAPASFYQTEEVKNAFYTVFNDLKAKGIIDPRMYARDEVYRGKYIIKYDFRSTDPTLESKFDENGDSTIAKMLDTIAGEKGGLSPLAAILRENIGEIGDIRVSLAKDIVGERDEIINGVYFPIDNVIRINSHLYNYRNHGNANNIIMHEIIHAIVANKEKTKEQLLQLKSIFNEVRTAFMTMYGANSIDELKKAYERTTGRPGRDLYGLTNVDEFVAELMTNATFVHLVNDLSMFYNGISDNRQLSIWDRIIDWIVKVLNINLEGPAKDAFFIINDIILYGGNKIQNDVHKRNLNYSYNFSDEARALFEKSVLPQLNDMTDSEIQHRLDQIELPVEMQSTEEERVQAHKKATTEMQSHVENYGTPDFVITESEGDYQQRTDENAQNSDVTLSFAVDYSTLGENRTRKAAKGKYIPIPIDFDNPKTIDKVIEEWEKLGISKTNVTVNIAGNGIYTLKDVMSQEELGWYVSDWITNLQNAGITIAKIRTGGQSGVDEAGAIAGWAHQIPTEIHAPKGFVYRDENNKTIAGYENFAARFPSVFVLYKNETAEEETIQSPFDKFLDNSNLEPGVSITVGDYMNQGGAAINLGDGLEEGRNPLVENVMFEKYPEQVYKNDVQQSFERECRLTEQEMNELCEDVANTLYLLFDDILNVQPIREMQYMFYPDIFRESVQKEIDRIITHPRDKQFVELASAIGTDNLLYIIRDGMLNNLKCPAEMREKLQIFSDGNKYGQDYMRLLMLNANPWLDDRLGLTFNTSMTKKEAPKAEKSAYPTDTDSMDADAGDTATFTEVVEEQLDDEDSNTDEDMSRGDFIKKDSLLKSFSDNIDKPVKEALSNIVRRDRVNAFGKGTCYSWSEIANPLVSIIAESEDSDEMYNTIKESQLPYRDELLNILDNDNNIKSALFSNFKKNPTTYFEIETGTSENGGHFHRYTRSLKSLNKRDATERLTSLAASNDKLSLFRMEGNELVVIPERIAVFEQLIASLPKLGSNIAITPENFKTNYSDERLATLNTLFGMLGFKSRINVDGLRRWAMAGKIKVVDGQKQYLFDNSKYNDLVNMFKTAFTSITQLNAGYTNGNPVARISINGNRPYDLGGLEDIVYRLEQVVDGIVGQPADNRVNSGNNDYNGYVNSNYMGRLFGKMKDYKKRTSFIDRQYSKSPFFKRLFELEKTASSTRGWKPLSWLTDMRFSRSDNSRMQLRTMATHNDKKFQELTLSEIVTTALLAYNVQNSENLADYIVPVMSDKSRTCVISQFRYKVKGYGSKTPLSNGASYAEAINSIDFENDDIVIRLYAVMLQELDRMRDIMLRAKNPDIQHIANYDITLADDGTYTPKIDGKSGMEFSFMPMFNGLLRDINDDEKCKNNRTVAWMHDKIYGDRKYADTYDVNTVGENVKRFIGQWMEMQWNILYSKLAAKGILADIEANIGMSDSAFRENFREFFYNNYFANTQIFMILAGDLAFYKGDNDITKRFAEVLSDGMVQDAAAEGAYEHAKEEGDARHANFIVLNDQKRVFRGYEGLMKMHKQRRDKNAKEIERQYNNGTITQERYEQLMSRNERLYQFKRATYGWYNEDGSAEKGFDATDGQGFLSFNGYYSLMKSLGRSKDLDAIKNEFTALYDDFARLFTSDKPSAKAIEEIRDRARAFNAKNRMHFEVVKDFCYTQIVDEDGTSRPFQCKDSKFPLLDIEMMCEDALDEDGIPGDSSMARLAAFMHTNDIDAAVFESCVKVGASRVLDFNTDLHKAALNSESRQKWIHKVPVADYMLQQETPDHSEDSTQPIGAQIKNLLFGALNMDDEIVDHTTGKKVRVADMRREYEDVQARRIRRAVDKEMEKAGLDGRMNIVDRNMKLSKYIKDKLATGGQLDYDTDFRFSVNNNGDFNIPLSDPVSRNMVDRIFTGAVKRCALEVPIPGGQLVQVTDAFRFRKDKTTVKEDKSLRIAYKRKDGSITYNPDEAVSVAYYEAEMPYYYKDMYKLQGGKGNFDERLSQLVMYRIPTEGACSAYPIKVVKWSNRISGGIVKLPAELPGIGGMDFDIDKLFFMAPSVSFSRERRTNPATGRTHSTVTGVTYVDYDYAKNNAGNDDKADCNRLLEIMWSVLTSPQNMKAMFIPSNFYDLTHCRDLLTALGNITYKSDEEKVTRYKELQSMNDSDLESEAGKAYQLGVCNYGYQSETALINSMAKQLIGIFANANSQHTYLQGLGLRLYCDNLTNVCAINGNMVGYENEFDPVMAQDGVTRVTENINQFIPAAADAVKNPTLYQLNINMFTVNLATALLRTGFDIETVVLILQQPVMKYLSREYDKESTRIKSDEYVDIDKLLERVIAQRVSLLGLKGKKRKAALADALRPSTSEVTLSDLVSGVGIEIGTLADKSTKEVADAQAQLKSNQWELFKILYGFMKVKSEVQGSNAVMKVDVASQRHGTNIFEYADLLIRIMSREEQNISGFPQLATDGSDKIWQRHITSFKQQWRLLNAYAAICDPNLINFLLRVNDDFRTLMYRPSPNAKVPRVRTAGIYGEYLSYLFVNDPKGTNRFSFGENGAKGYIPSSDAFVKYMNVDFPQKVAAMKSILLENREYQNNVFLNKLEVKEVQGEIAIRIPQKSLSKRDKAKIGGDFEALLNSENPEVSMFAYNLLIYSFIVTGLRTGRDTFWQYIPARVMYRFKNYLAFLRSVNGGFFDNEQFPVFAEAFMFNNLDLAKTAEGDVAKSIRSNPYNATPHRGALDNGFHVAVGGPNVSASVTVKGKTIGAAPIGRVYEFNESFPFRNYDNSKLVPLDRYLEVFDSAVMHFDNEMSKVEYGKIGVGDMVSYDVSKLSDKQVMDIINSEQFKALREIDPYLGKNAVDARNYLSLFSLFC